MPALVSVGAGRGSAQRVDPPRSPRLVHHVVGAALSGAFRACGREGHWGPLRLAVCFGGPRGVHDSRVQASANWLVDVQEHAHGPSSSPSTWACGSAAHGGQIVSGLIHHRDCGAQAHAISYTGRLALVVAGHRAWEARHQTSLTTSAVRLMGNLLCAERQARAARSAAESGSLRIDFTASASADASLGG